MKKMYAKTNHANMDEIDISIRNSILILSVHIF